MSWVARAWVVLFRDRNAVMSHSEGLARRRRDYPGQVRSAARRTPHGVAPCASRLSLRRNPVGVRRRGERRRSRVCPPGAGQPFAMRCSRFAAGTRLAFALLNGDESTPLVPRSLRFPKMFTVVVHRPPFGACQEVPLLPGTHPVACGDDCPTKGFTVRGRCFLRNHFATQEKSRAGRDESSLPALARGFMRIRAG